MNQPTPQLPPRLQDIVEDFSLCEGEEKLELLLEYAEKMPPLPPHLNRETDFEQVHECMTPVFVHAEMENGGLVFYFDIPPESPTVRGFASLLAEGLRGASPEQVLAVPYTFFQQMGLHTVLSGQRMNGLHAILAYLKRLASQQIEQTQS
ncbi:MAG: SufE family protein [Chloroflexi bacterium]|nr:MAG: SufE family protein [Chloroflexota bacterium]